MLSSFIDLGLVDGDVIRNGVLSCVQWVGGWGGRGMRVCSLEKLRLWLSEDLSSSKSCQEICKRAYSRLCLISKLKCVGVKTEDIIEIFVESTFLSPDI